MTKADKKADIKVNLSGLELDNPVIPASGTFGFGKEFMDYYDINILGSIAVKAVTLEERFGNDQPRIAECKAGMINSVGLQNKGLDHVVEHEFKELAKVYNKPVIANISGFTVDEYLQAASRIDQVDNVGILEINVSCPNVHQGGMAFGTDAKNVENLTREIKKICKKPVYMKLTPNVTDIVAIAKAAEAGGADGVSLINTMLGMRIDTRTRRPVIANKMGGYSGPGIFPVALRMVYQVYEAVDIPIMGIGGIDCADDVLQMVMAGTSAVQVGAANLVNPMACPDIIGHLPERMEELGISSLEEIRGIAHKA